MFHPLDMLCNSLIAEARMEEARKRGEVVLISILAEEKGMPKLFDRVEERKLFDVVGFVPEREDRYYIGLDGFIFGAYADDPLTKEEMDAEGVVFGPFSTEKEARDYLASHKDVR